MSLSGWNDARIFGEEQVMKISILLPALRFLVADDAVHEVEAAEFG
tara:strand:+ start:312 stop:449 length:138 start_codon:yes stop_codon:yes gene_type:complete